MAEYIEKWSIVNRLIDLENEFQQYKPFHGFEHAMYRKICETEIAIGKMPAADVEPVRHAHWIECDDYYDGGLHLSEYKCNICGAPETMFYGKYPTYKYCHCGAKMDERKDK